MEWYSAEKHMETMLEIGAGGVAEKGGRKGGEIKAKWKHEAGELSDLRAV